MRSTALLPLVVLLIAASCTASGPAAVLGPEEVLVLEVSHERVPCIGEMQGECLQVRAPGEEAWRTFYDTIEGFDYEEGTRYTIEVGRRERYDPPADASSYVYRLIRLLEAVKVTG